MKTLNIMIVDDDAPTREALMMAFECIPHVKVLGVADNGEEAISLVKQETFHIVTMDFQMPGLDGIETTKRIKQISPNVQVIAYSSDETIGQSILRAGADHFLLKPATVRSIENIIEILDIA